MRRISAIAVVVALGVGWAAYAARTTLGWAPSAWSVTGKGIVTNGDGEGLGSLPTSMVDLPGSRWAVVVSTGRREQLSVLDLATRKIASTLAIDPKDAVYGPVATDAAGNVYVARGFKDDLSVYSVSAQGALSETVRIPVDEHPAPPGWPRFAGGVAVVPSGNWAYVSLNATSAWTKFRGGVEVVDLVHRRPVKSIDVDGFPLAVSVAGNRLFVASERDNCVQAFDIGAPQNPKLLATIPVGKHPSVLKLDAGLGRLYVVNTNSDTLSVLDLKRLKVVKTLLMRPAEALDLPGATPTDVAIDSRRNRLYLPLADMNAVAAVNRKDLRLLGFMPTANYPSAATVAPNGSVMVACARGERARIPNGSEQGPGGAWGRSDLAIQEGSIEPLAYLDGPSLKDSTAKCVASNRLNPDWKALVDVRYRELRSLGVKHVVYVVKENRTYDQVLGDMREGNGDPSLVDFGEEITPNHHALARRFVLMDNYYCCADVSADGWTWSVAGMIPNYNARNTPVLYSDRGRAYDFEGQNNGTAVEYLGYNDVGAAPGGYLWDDCLAKGLSFRNYGFRISTADEDEKGPDGKYLNEAGRSSEAALDKYTDRNFGFGLDYADSDVWRTYHCASPKQRLTYGKYGSTSRIAEWTREFKQKGLPALTFITLQRDHTAANTPGLHTPSAMVADNDYALGLLVQTISHSRFWKDTAIVVVEDDPSNGYDHVDCHRSLCLVISPLVPAHTVDHSFGNTVTTIRSIEALLGLPAMNQYDRSSLAFGFLSPSAHNDAPFEAIMPPAKVVSAVNTASAYRANEFTVEDFRDPDKVDEEAMRDIVCRPR